MRRCGRRFDTGRVALVAARCLVTQRGRPVDCRADRLAADLKKQVEEG